MAVIGLGPLAKVAGYFRLVAQRFVHVGLFIEHGEDAGGNPTGHAAFVKKPNDLVKLPPLRFLGHRIGYDGSHVQ
jgi:hypothetical protein